MFSILFKQTSKSGFIVVFLLAVSPFSSVALAQSAQGDTPITSINYTNTPPVVDGVISDGEWDASVLIEDFHQMNPIEYAQPSERTEVRLLYDQDAIYIGARMYDSNPELINSKILRQGSGLPSEDRLKVMLGPYNDKRSGYEFETNANGVRGGGLYKNGSVDRNWEGIWEASSRLTNFGWVTEIRIPFKTLSFEGEGDWGFNLTRQIPHKNETISWSSGNRQYSPAYSGVLTGLQNLSQGIGLDIVPALSLTGHRDYELDEKDSNVEPSLDLYYKLTPSINGSLTFNTDFSATEVDSRQVDLSRFSLFFPEKRDFFLRESDIFEFGGIGAQGNNNTLSRPDRENARPYFSRRIGLGADGAPVGLDAGAKVTGRYGRYNFGIMSLLQEEAVTSDGTIEATTLSVARASANILGESNIGFIATNGDPRTNLDNSLFGLDFRYRNTRLAQGRSIEADVWYQQTDTEGLEGDDVAYGFSVDSPNQTGFRGYLSGREIQQNFNPTLGFVSRSNVRQYVGQVGYTHRVNSDLIRSIFAGVDGQRVNEIGGGLQSENILLRLLEIETSREDEFQFRVNSEKENIREDFEISDGIVIDSGEYSFTSAELAFESARHRVANVNFSYTVGDFYDGDIRSIGGEVAWRPSKRYELGLSYDVDNIDLPSGSFSTKLATAKLNIAFSNRLSWVNLVQYDNVSESIGINSRLQWTPKAGQNFFFVINQNYIERENDPNSPFTSNRSFHSDTSDITLKFDYTYRF